MERASRIAKDKLKVIEYAKTHGTNSASLKYGVNDRTRRKWVSMEQKLRACSPRRRAFRGRGAKWQQLEETMKNWVLNRRENGLRVTTICIRKKAVEFAREQHANDFTGGAHWCYDFMKRNGFSVRSRTSVGQPLPIDYKETIKNFRRFVMAETNTIVASNLRNFDEVPVPFDIVGNRTVDVKGKDNVRISLTGHEKTNFTVVLGVTADGEKLKPMLIFKRAL